MHEDIGTDSSYGAIDGYLFVFTSILLLVGVWHAMTYVDLVRSPGRTDANELASFSMFLSAAIALMAFAACLMIVSSAKLAPSFVKVFLFLFTIYELIVIAGHLLLPVILDLAKPQYQRALWPAVLFVWAALSRIYWERSSRTSARFSGNRRDPILSFKPSRPHAEETRPSAPASSDDSSPTTGSDKIIQRSHDPAFLEYTLGYELRVCRRCRRGSNPSSQACEFCMVPFRASDRTYSPGLPAPEHDAIIGDDPASLLVTEEASDQAPFPDAPLYLGHDPIESAPPVATRSKSNPIEVGRWLRKHERTIEMLALILAGLLLIAGVSHPAVGMQGMFILIVGNSIQGLEVLAIFSTLRKREPSRRIVHLEWLVPRFSIEAFMFLKGSVIVMSLDPFVRHPDPSRLIQLTAGLLALWSFTRIVLVMEGRFDSK